MYPFAPIVNIYHQNLFAQFLATNYECTLMGIIVVGAEQITNALHPINIDFTCCPPLGMRVDVREGGKWEKWTGSFHVMGKQNPSIDYNSAWC